ncbi:MAG: preprotein translocase subunit YajC, partial [Oscillospiraceae bacterium]
FMFMPQKKQQKKDAQMRSNLDIGDEILTQGGILGRVVSMKEDTIVIETGSDRVKLRIVRGAVIQNTTPKEAPPAPAKKEKKEKVKEIESASKEKDTKETESEAK